MNLLTRKPGFAPACCVLAALAGCGLASPALSASDEPGLPLEPTRKLEFETREGTWLSLDVGPGGRNIYFDLLGDIYAVSTTGGAAQALTRGMAFDTQPVASPDGSLLAFISDRSGAENIWVMHPDGTGMRQVTFRDDNHPLVSPEWSADGQAIYASVFRADLNAYALWRFDADGHEPARAVIPVRADDTQDRGEWLSAIDVSASADGRYLYYSGHRGGFDSASVPEWTIRRRDLRSGADETVVSAPRSPRPDLSLGSYFRPVVSPDGRRLVYGTRFDGQTGLRLLDLETREDRWLAYPVTNDQAMAAHWQGILPRYDFTPDGQAIVLNRDGKISRLDLQTGRDTVIPFSANVSIGLGPDQHVPIDQESGPVRARLIQAPEVSPDGRQLAFSALASIYRMDLAPGATPRRVNTGTLPTFHPSWSPDGTELAYVDWTARDAGHIWITPLDETGVPRQLTSKAAFYTHPVFTPDGHAIVALRSSNSVRMRTYMDYGLYRDAELVLLPLDGSAERIISSGQLGGKPGFSRDGQTLFINAPDGVNAVPLGGGDRRIVIQVLGPGWYFAESPVPVDNLRVSPDGQWALAQVAQQLHLVAVPEGKDRVVDLTDPAVPFRKITTVGADFFSWSADSKTIHWAVGSTWYRRPLAEVDLNPAHSPNRGADAPAPGQGGVAAFEAVVEIPRDRPHGSLLLSGATVITMAGIPDNSGGSAGVIENADLLIVDDRIAAVGPKGTLDVPDGTPTRDVSGLYIAPGFIDTHDHLADIRREILDLETWSPAASLAYGVTTKFDPSSLSIDMLAYEDMVDAGMITGSRIHTTGPALFSFNEFKSKNEVIAVLKRYRDHYRNRNIKMYRSGNRQVRQWVAMASAELGMLATAEGALAMKLGLSQVMDGFGSQEHALPAAPLYEDVITLMASSGASYTTTLMITNGGPEGQDYFIALNDPVEDPVLNRFWPRYAIDIKMRQRAWRTLDDYFFPEVAESAARIARAGGLVGIGSHGEAPGISYHWEMQAHAMGGMSAAEILRAATLGGAKTIGRDHEFGSLEEGKYADLVILQKDPLENIDNTLSLLWVMKNGRLYEAATLDEIWPRQRAWTLPWFHADRPLPILPGNALSEE